MSYNELRQLFPTMRLEFDQPLSLYTYTRTGGSADVIAFPSTVEEVQNILRWTQEQDVPLTILGNASNLIVKDGGIRGVVMILTDMNTITVTDNLITATAGASLIDTTRKALTEDLTGLEFACGIPGSIGGAVYMNAGAYGGEVRDVIESVEALDRSGERHIYTNEECDFGYRHSRFQEDPVVVISVTFKLAKGDPAAIESEMAHLMMLRESKQPLEYPSCGSVFKRPEGYFTGKLIQDAGLQGYRIGGAEVSKKHAGFIVNVDNATATDYLQLIEYIQQTIWEKNQVRLEPEVKIIGED